MKTVFLEEFRAELAEAALWYDTHSLGLGDAFLEMADRVTDDITAEPLANREITSGFRKANLTRFPYTVIYAVEADQIVFHAIMHLHREPNYWRGRQQH